jgi:hypothetical protein
MSNRERDGEWLDAHVAAQMPRLPAAADLLAREHAAMLAERKAIIDALDLRGTHCVLLTEIVTLVAEARVAQELRAQARATTDAIIEAAQRGALPVADARVICDASPAAIIDDVRTIGAAERRAHAIGAATERAGWVRAIAVCQAFGKWRARAYDVVLCDCGRSIVL